MMKILIKVLIVFFIANCGVNTATPTIPFIFLTPPATPQIAGIVSTSEIPVDPAIFSGLPSEMFPYKPEFILKYYVTNTEQNFVGYNLIITAAVPSLADTQIGAAIYSENGVVPSFPHIATEASTDPSRIKKRKIANRIPAPGIYPFQHCEVYTFTMRTFFSNGAPSNPSVPVSACASLNPAKCLVGTSCNSTTCSNASCTTAEKATCFVGTACNPCLVSGGTYNGCECPPGTSPPGCNP